MSGLNLPSAARQGEGEGVGSVVALLGTDPRHLSPHCSSSSRGEPSRRAGAEFNATQFLRVARQLREDYSSREQDVRISTAKRATVLNTTIVAHTPRFSTNATRCARLKPEGI